MALNLPDILQHGNPLLPIVDSLNVSGGLKLIATFSNAALSASYSTSPDKFKLGTTLFVNNTNSLYYLTGADQTLTTSWTQLSTGFTSSLFVLLTDYNATVSNIYASISVNTAAIATNTNNIATNTINITNLNSNYVGTVSNIYASISVNTAAIARINSTFSNYVTYNNATTNINLNNKNINNISNLSVGTTSVLAELTLGAGGTAANSAPLKYISGRLLTIPENGAMEFDGTHSYLTINNTRLQMDNQPGSIDSSTSSYMAYYRNNGSTISGTNALIVTTNSNIIIGTNTYNALDRLQLNGSFYQTNTITSSNNNYTHWVDNTIQLAGTASYVGLKVSINENAVGTGTKRMIELTGKPVGSATNSFTVDSTGYITTFQSVKEEMIEFSNTDSTTKTYLGVGRIGAIYGQNTGFISWGTQSGTPQQIISNNGFTGFSNLLLYNSSTTPSDMLVSNPSPGNTSGLNISSNIKISGGGLRPNSAGYALLNLQSSNGNNSINATLSNVGDYIGVRHMPTLFLSGAFNSKIVGFRTIPTVSSLSPNSKVYGFEDSTSFTSATHSGAIASFVVATTINATVGATGIHRGLHINPTITSAVGGWRSIEDNVNSIGGYSIYQSGSLMLNYFAGKLLIGSTVNTGAALQVTGNVNLSSFTSGTTSNSVLTTGTDGNILLQTKSVYGLFDHYVDVGNILLAETDLYSDIMPSILVNNGDKIRSEYGGTFLSSATATRQIRLYFAGSVIFDTGMLSLSLNASWSLYVMIIRVSSSVVRYNCSLTTQGAALSAYTSVGELTGLTLPGSNILKITGQSAGVGAATNDIIAKSGSVEYASKA